MIQLKEMLDLLPGNRILLDLEKKRDRLPKPALGRMTANQCEVIRGHANERRAKHCDERNILQRIIQDGEQVNEVQYFGRGKESISLGLKGYAHSFERLCISLQFAGSGAEQNHH